MISKEVLLSDKEKLLQEIAQSSQNITNQLSILTAIEKLETSSTNFKPLKFPELLEGNWQLLYTTNKRQLLDTKKKPLINHRIPGFKRGKTYQGIKENRIYNILELDGLFGIKVIICGIASFKAISETRARVDFKNGIIGLQGFTSDSSLQLIDLFEKGKTPLGISFAYNKQMGWVETSYLDEDLRIVRGNREGIYVLRKI